MRSPSIRPTAEAEMRHRLTARPIALAGAYRALESEGAGAVVLFAGRVRPDATRRGRVEALEYEADRSHGLRSFQAIARAASGKYPGVRLLLWHRNGVVPVGQIAVIVGAAAPPAGRTLSGLMSNSTTSGSSTASWLIRWIVSYRAGRSLGGSPRTPARSGNARTDRTIVSAERLRRGASRKVTSR